MKKLILATIVVALLCPPVAAERPDDELHINLREKQKLGVSVNTIWVAVSQLATAGLLGMTNDPAAGDALRWLLSKRDAKGRWALEVRNPDRTKVCGPLWREEVVGKPSKWITLSALIQMKRFAQLLDGPATEATEAPPESVAQRRFADYPFAASRDDEKRVRKDWSGCQMEAILTDLLAFARERRLKRGWHWGLVLGPSWCREWLAAKPVWVPRPRWDRAWPVCRLFFLARSGQFTPEQLSKRLRIPVEDVREKKAFPKMFRNSFWRIAVREWKHGCDEIGLTLRQPAEFAAIKPVLREALASLPR